MSDELHYLGHDLTPIRDLMATLSRLENRNAPEIADSEEARTRFAEQAQEVVRTWWEEGRRQGRQECPIAGEARLLLWQLQCKFGPLDAVAMKRFIDAVFERLLVCAERVLTANRLEDVLD